jgi:hypothetical protein
MHYARPYECALRQFCDENRADPVPYFAAANNSYKPDLLGQLPEALPIIHIEAKS